MLEFDARSLIDTIIDLYFNTEVYQSEMSMIVLLP